MREKKLNEEMTFPSVRFERRTVLHSPGLADIRGSQLTNKNDS